MAKKQIVLLFSLLLLLASSAVIKGQGSASGKSSGSAASKQGSASDAGSSTSSQNSNPSLKIDPNSPYSKLSVDELNKMISDLLSKSKNTPPAKKTVTPAAAPPVQTPPKTEETAPAQDPQIDQTLHQSVDVAAAETNKTDPSIAANLLPSTNGDLTAQVNTTTIADSSASVIDQTSDAHTEQVQADTSSQPSQGNNKSAVAESAPAVADSTSTAVAVNAVNNSTSSSVAVKAADNSTFIVPKLTALMTTNSTTVEGYVPPTNVGLCKDDNECQLNYHDYIVAGLTIACNPKIGVCEAS